MPFTPAQHVRARVRRAFKEGKPAYARGSANKALLREMIATQEDQREASAAEESSTYSASNASGVGHHLYIMRRSDAPAKLKIGRSNDPVNRAPTLQSGHCFHMSVLATFPNAGSKEHAVHAILQQHRVLEGPGNEWFNVSLSQAVSAVSMVLDQ